MEERTRSRRNKNKTEGEREMRRNGRENVNRGSRSSEEAAGETNKGDKLRDERKGGQEGKEARADASPG